MTAGPYYETFDVDDNYTQHRFTGDERGIQTRELNEIQLREHYKLKKIAERFVSTFVDSGGFTSIDGSGVVTLADSYVFVDGNYLKILGGTVTIPDSIGVKVGVRVTDSTITSTEDASLLNPATGTAGYDKPGADRTKKTLAWGWVADDTSNDGGSGTFYPTSFFYNRLFLAERRDVRPPRALINNDDFSGMTVFDDILYDFDLSNVNVTADIILKVDNDSFYNYSQSGTKYFADFLGTIATTNRIVKIERLDPAITFNGQDIDLNNDQARVSFFIKRESDTEWFVTGINYGN